MKTVKKAEEIRVHLKNKIFSKINEVWQRLPQCVKGKMSKRWEGPNNRFVTWIKYEFGIYKGIRQAKRNIYHYESLMPRDDVDQEEHYISALNWAILNPDITNVALMGAYGSGKSSILQSYKKKYLKSKKKYIEISLAKFCSSVLGEGNKQIVQGSPSTYTDIQTTDEDEEEREREVTGQEEMLEKSILQQMFYSVDPEKIPLSRYKRIKKVSWLSSAFMIVGICVGLLLFNNSYKEHIKSLVLEEPHMQLIGYTIPSIIIVSTRAIFIVLIVIILIKSIQYIRQSFRLNQFEVKGAQVERKGTDDESIFDKRLEELLYLFEKMKYKVVFIEDLDRFNSIQIFTKLRELNMLINSTKKRKNKVVFVYALRDELFKDYKDRTKFFDFIIPVIPYINSSNSGEIFAKKINRGMEGTQEEISKQFISDITIFIEDTRTLNNICNEYQIYRSNLLKPMKRCREEKEVLDTEKLLAMIVYKNIYPADFAQIQYGRGTLHKVFHENKKTTKNEIAKQLSEESQTIKDELYVLDKEALVSEEELSTIYREALIRWLGGDEVTVYFDGNLMPLKELRNIGFEEICNKQLHRLASYYILCTADQIQTIFSSMKKFSDRKADILKRGELREKLYNLQVQIQYIQRKKVRELWGKDTEEILLGKEGKSNKLLAFMLRKGYIDETYYSYVSYFYEGAITNEDRAFILSVKTQEQLDWGHDLTNIDEIINRLEKEDFGTKCILNYRLLDGMIFLKNSHVMNDYSTIKDIQIMQESFSTKWNTLINLITNEKSLSLEFIDGFMNIGEGRIHFIKELCKVWHDIWRIIENTSSWSKEQKDKYLFKIMQYVDKENIIEIDRQSDLSKYIAKMSNFLEDLSSGKYIPLRENWSDINTQVIELIEHFHIKFENLRYKEESRGVYDFIYNNNYYVINYSMIDEILGKYGQEEINLVDECYSAIINTKLDKLRNYIKENMHEYIINVLLVGNRLCETQEDSIIALLNEEKVINEDKELIISRINKPIYKLSDVNSDLWIKLMNMHKVEIDWWNILDYYGENGLDEGIIENLKIERNYKILALHQVDEREDRGTTQEEVEKLLHEIILCKDITNEVFKALFSSFTVEKLNVTTEQLIEGQVIEMRIKILLPYIKLTCENYTTLADWGKENNFNEYNELLINNIQVFIEDINNIGEYDLERKDVSYLIESERFAIIYKIKIVSSTFIRSWGGDKIFLNKIYLLFLQATEYKIDMQLMDDLLQGEIENEFKIRLVNQQMPYYKGEIDFLNRCLDRIMEDKDSIILGSQKSTTILYSEENDTLISKLEQLGYISRVSRKGSRIKFYLKKIAS